MTEWPVRKTGFAKHSLAVAVCALIAMGALAQTVAGAEPSGGPWPQWRGPEGTGVSTDPDLPEKWDENSANVKWKTPLAGRGCSSPIVSGDRVFITTAYEESASLATHHLVAGGILATAFFAMALARILTRLRPHRRQAGEASPGQLVNRVMAGAGVTAFFAAAIAMFFFPQQYDATVGEFLARALGTYDTEHLFYVGKEVDAATWLNTGAIALLGYATALYWLRAHSIWRLLGVLLFVPLAAGFVLLTPLDAWKYPVVLWTRLLFVAPGAVVALWQFLGYFEIRWSYEPETVGAANERAPLLQRLNNVRISWKHNDMHRVGGIQSMVLFVLMTALAAIIFVPINFLLPQRNLCRAVVCLDFSSGEVLWQRPIFTAPGERKHRDNSHATPTPATDGRHVVANFGLGVACLDFDGRVIWRHTDPHYLADTRYGAVASVLMWEGKTLIIQEREENTKRATWMAAFDTASGEVLWKVYPHELQMGYTTGFLHDDGTGMKLMIASFESVLCFDLANGRLLWQHEIPVQQIVAGVTKGDAIFAVGGGTWGPNALLAFTLGAPQGCCPVQELWQSEDDTPGCASPVIYNGLLFSITDRGVMRAYDLTTGELYWRKRLPGRYLASLVAGDGKVYAANTAGLTTVVAAEPKLRILGRNKLSDGCYASFAVVQSHLIVRTGKYIYCIAPDAPENLL